MAAKISPAMLSALLRLTRIDNDRMHQALHDHLVLGHSREAAAERYGYTRQQVDVNARNILKNIKPACDDYAAALAAYTAISAEQGKANTTEMDN